MTDQKRSRRQIYIVHHSSTRSVWKHLFFMRSEHALDAVMRFYGDGKSWKKKGKNAIQSLALGTFTVMVLKEFTTIGDVEYSDNTKRIKGEDHK